MGTFADYGHALATVPPATTRTPPAPWPLQDIRLVRGLFILQKTILYYHSQTTPTLPLFELGWGLGALLPLPPFIAHIIARYSVSPRQACIAILVIHVIYSILLIAISCKKLSGSPPPSPSELTVYYCYCKIHAIYNIINKSKSNVVSPPPPSSKLTVCVWQQHTH